jgi:LAS superfamily LD-carboxypeptidase LdcB
MRFLPFLLFSVLLIQACQSQSSKTNEIALMENEATDALAASDVPIDSHLLLILNDEYVRGQFEPSERDDFVRIARKYADREGMYLRKEVYEAFLEMYEAAQADGINLQIRSATRNFKNQKRIWENKWTGKTLIENGENLAKTTPDAKARALKILRFSSMPSTSRHHWGTDMDLNAFNNAYFAEGEGKKIYDWLVANAPSFGFCQPYTAKDEKRPEGYFEEKWHWSYLPTALPLTRYYEENIPNERIEGFLGAEAAKAIGVVEKYVLGISEPCTVGSER